MSVQIRKSMMNNSLILLTSAFSDKNSLDTFYEKISYLDKQMYKEYLSIPIGFPIGNSDFFEFYH